jgi:hypothetical protein
MTCFCLFICFVIVLLLSANAGDANAPITTAATAKTVTNLELCGSSYSISSNMTLVYLC